MMSMASPELLPGAGTPRISYAGTPLKRDSFCGPYVHLAVENADSGTIPPFALRTYHCPRSSGCIRA